MSLRSDSGVYIKLCGPRGDSDETRREDYRTPHAWDTDHDGWQNGAKTDLPHNTVPILAAGSDATHLKQLFSVSGPHFNNVSVYLKKLRRAGTVGAGPLAKPPIMTFSFRTGIPCACDHWKTATVQTDDYDQVGLLWSGVFPFAQALEIYGGIIDDETQPANSVLPVEVKLRIVVAYSANDLGLAAFEATPASLTNGITVTLGP